MALVAKAVFDNLLLIGHAATRGEVKRLLQRSGYSEAAAESACQHRLAEAPDFFELIPVVELAALLERLRRYHVLCLAALPGEKLCDRPADHDGEHRAA